MWPQLFTDSELETNKNYAWEYSMCILQLFTLSLLIPLGKLCGDKRHLMLSSKNQLHTRLLMTKLTDIVEKRLQMKKQLGYCNG